MFLHGAPVGMLQARAGGGALEGAVLRFDLGQFPAGLSHHRRIHPELEEQGGQVLEARGNPGPGEVLAPPSPWIQH